MHICMDEIWAFVYALPVLGWAFVWVRSKIRTLKKKENRK